MLLRIYQVKILRESVLGGPTGRPRIRAAISIKWIALDGLNPKTMLKDKASLQECGRLLISPFDSPNKEIPII